MSDGTVQDRYILDVFGVDPATSGIGGPGSDAGPLPATETDMFFAKDSADLTPGDRASLDAYAKSYLAAGGAGSVTVRGFASPEGDARHNQALAAQRAQAVVDYLVKAGVAAGSVSGAGQGPTNQFGDKPEANRRAVVAPKPAAAAAPPTDAPLAEPPKPPPGPLLPLSDEKLQDIANRRDGASRDQVEKELTSFLEALQTSQGGRSVKVTDKVRMAGHHLAEGLGDPDLQIGAMLSDDRFNYVPAELARKIAKALPDFIPQANFQKFLSLKPKDIAAPENLSFAGAIAKLITPDIKKAVGFLPKDWQDKVVKGIEAAVEKGLVAIADKAMDGSGLDDGAKKAIHSAVEAAIKQKGH